MCVCACVCGGGGGVDVPHLVINCSCTQRSIEQYIYIFANGAKLKCYKLKFNGIDYNN